jgi:hypothetical protein
MKTLVAIATVVVFSSTAASATDGQVPRASLVRMGLGALQPVSDSQGSQIRGQSMQQANISLRLVEITVTTYKAVPVEKVFVIPNTHTEITYTSFAIVPVQRVIVVPVAQFSRGRI